MVGWNFDNDPTGHPGPFKPVSVESFLRPRSSISLNQSVNAFHSIVRLFFAYIKENSTAKESGAEMTVQKELSRDGQLLCIIPIKSNYEL